jgi:glycerol kinase
MQIHYLASLDQSTTTTKFSLYLTDGTLAAQELVPHAQIANQENWLEHDPAEIVDNVHKAISVVMEHMGGTAGFEAKQILGLGLCNQRETVVCWDAESQKPLHNAIVWCDARTKDVCERFKLKHGSFAERTGLPVSTYFTAFKIIWLMENVEGLRDKVKAGKVRFGTIDTWVALKLTGKYVTDASNASRTHLMDITTGQWDKQLLDIVGISENCLPQIVDSFQQVGNVLEGPLKGVPLMCILGDQQSSAYAHTLTQTSMKITYGTGCFMLNNIGKHPTFGQSFVTTILSQSNGEREYGFEVAVECGGGTINWARMVGFFDHYDQLNHLPDRSDDLYFMPSFGTIFSPFWLTGVKGGMIGVTFNTRKEHILRAILDAITFRLFDSIKDPKFDNVSKIIVDGGMTVNE